MLIHDYNMDICRLNELKDEFQCFFDDDNLETDALDADFFESTR